MHCNALLALVGTARLAQAAYVLSDDYLSNGFFSNWDFFTGDDPTGGYVNYVDQSTAQSSGYISTNSDGSIYLGVDYTNVASGRGRNSVRLTSQQAYTHYLTVIDLGHMPGGICGTWPAFWSFGSGGSGWPSEGEIDIIEGANDQQQNYMTLHTSAGCEIPTTSDSLVQAVTDDCDAAANGNEGCSFHDPNSNTYGSQFNAQGGGTYATEWTSQGISIWFWPAGSAPSDALGDGPDPSGWGTPTALWSGPGCDWDEHFMDHNLVFDTTFCGSWAGNAFQSCAAANGGQTCNDFVQNNPSAFQEAYWQINALKVYQDNGSGSSSPSSTVSSSTSTAAATTPAISVSSTTLATLPTSAAASSSSLSLVQESSGGIFIQPTTSSTPASTPAPVTTQAPAPAATSTSTELEQENSTGGVFEPVPSSTSTEFELENSTGGIYEPVPTNNDFLYERRQLAHLHQHIRGDVKF